MSRIGGSRGRKRGQYAAVGHAALSWTALLDAAQLRRKASKVADLGFDVLQVVFRYAINARTSPARLHRETQKIPELVQREPQGAAAPDELQPIQVFAPVHSVISNGARRNRHQLDVLVIAYRHHLDSRRLRQLSDTESLI